MQERTAMEKTIERLDSVMDLLVNEFSSEVSKNALENAGANTEQIIEYRRVALDDICRVAEAITYAYSKAHGENTPE